MEIITYYDVNFAGTKYVPPTTFKVASVIRDAESETDIDTLLEECPDEFYFVHGNDFSPMFYSNDEEVLHCTDFLTDLSHAMEDCLTSYDYANNQEEYEEEGSASMFWWEMVTEGYGADDYYLSQCGIASLKGMNEETLWETGIQNVENWSMIETRTVLIDDNGVETDISR